MWDCTCSRRINFSSDLVLQNGYFIPHASFLCTSLQIWLTLYCNSNFSPQAKLSYRSICRKKSQYINLQRRDLLSVSLITPLCGKDVSRLGPLLSSPLRLVVVPYWKSLKCVGLYVYILKVARFFSDASSYVKDVAIPVRLSTALGAYIIIGFSFMLDHFSMCFVLKLFFLVIKVAMHVTKENTGSQTPIFLLTKV